MDCKKSYSKIIAKAWSDPKFKERLCKNPAKVFEEQGIKLPQGKKLELHENNDKIIHFVIPEKPHGDLSMQELQTIAAGSSTNCYIPVSQ